MQNIAKKDPGRARQNSPATAGTYFRKPGAHNKVDNGRFHCYLTSLLAWWFKTVSTGHEMNHGICSCVQHTEWEWWDGGMELAGLGKPSKRGGDSMRTLARSLILSFSLKYSKWGSSSGIWRLDLLTLWELPDLTSPMAYSSPTSENFWPLFAWPMSKVSWFYGIFVRFYMKLHYASFNKLLQSYWIVIHTSGCTGLGNNTCTWFRECCKQAEAEVVSNSRNKLHQTMYKCYFSAQ